MSSSGVLSREQVEDVIATLADLRECLRILEAALRRELPPSGRRTNLTIVGRSDA